MWLFFLPISLCVSVCVCERDCAVCGAYQNALPFPNIEHCSARWMWIIPDNIIAVDVAVAVTQFEPNITKDYPRLLASPGRPAPIEHWPGWLSLRRIRLYLFAFLFVFFFFPRCGASFQISLDTEYECDRHHVAIVWSHSSIPKTEQYYFIAHRHIKCVRECLRVLSSTTERRKKVEKQQLKKQKNICTSGVASHWAANTVWMCERVTAANKIEKKNRFCLSSPPHHGSANIIWCARHTLMRSNKCCYLRRSYRLSRWKEWRCVAVDEIWCTTKRKNSEYIDNRLWVGARRARCCRFVGIIEIDSVRPVVAYTHAGILCKRRTV